MKINTCFKISFLLFTVLLLAISCKNSSNNAETFTFESTVTPSNAGTVSPSGGSFESGEDLQITASPNSGWIFKEWNGDVSSSSNPTTVTITQNMSVNALFEQLTYPLTVEIEGEGEVSEQIVNAKTDYAEGTTVELTANPAENWEFVGWSGDLSGSENPTTVTMDQAKTVTAQFKLETYALTVNIEGEGEVSEDIVNAKSTDYSHGTMVELTAEPADEWRFVEWIGDLEGSESPTTITMDGPKTINANFEFGFNEDFEDGEAQNWIFSDDRFSIEDGKLRFSTGNDGNWGAAVYDQIFTDFKVETKVTRTRSKETDDYTLALFIRAKGDVKQGAFQDGYLIAITQAGWGAVFMYENGIETQFSPWIEFSEINDELGEYNVVTVNAVGSAFEIFLNGKYIITLTDDTFSAGYVAIGTYASDDGNNRVFWEYVKVTQADPLRNNTNEVQDALKNPSTAVEGNSKGHALER